MEVTVSGTIYNTDGKGKMLGKVDVTVVGDTPSDTPESVAEAYNRVMDMVTKEGD